MRRAARPPTVAAAVMRAPVFARWTRSSVGEGSALSLAFEVEQLPADHPARPGGAHQVAHDVADGGVVESELASRLGRAQRRERHHREAGRRGGRHAEHPVHRGPPAAHVVVVHAGQVVVHERVGVHDLDRRRQRGGVALPPAAS